MEKPKALYQLCVLSVYVLGEVQWGRSRDGSVGHVLFFIIYLFKKFLAVPLSLWDLISPTRG